MSVTLPTPTALAAEFVTTLKSWLTPVEFLQMRFRNAREESDLVCHSHDYCDANMAMDEAMRKLGLAEQLDSDSERLGDENALTDLWNSAWEKAMPALGRGAQKLATTDGKYAMVDELWWDVAQQAIVTQRMVDAHVSAASGVGIVVLSMAKEAANA